jgi:Bacterial archaeo-eukaryotic release factor family 3
VKLTTHYYVLSLGDKTSRLYEAFRDTLIDIQNKGFPIESSVDPDVAVDPRRGDGGVQEFIRTADRHFDHYLRQDPLRLVVVGEKKNLSIFDSVTMHGDVLTGKVEGDYSATSPHDLGKMVWPIVKEVMAGTGENTLHDLEAAENSQNVASGIDAVAHVAGLGTGGTLFVEEGYHLKGGIRETDHSLITSKDLDIQEVIDDAVDAIIEKVLEKGGNVVFLVSGSLARFQRIALVTVGL